MNTFKKIVAAIGAAAMLSTPVFAQEFLYGADTTQLNYVEDLGGKYYDFDGAEKDAMDILSENGINAVRIRLSNNTGKGTGDGTYYLPEGYQDLEDCIDLAKRAKEKNMAIQWTFNYSDYWSNGTRQIIPSDWAAEIKEELSFDVNDAETLRTMTDEQRKAIQQKLGNLVYDYTKSVLLRLKDEGITPEFVSFGNEINGGLFFPFANLYSANYNADIKELVFGDAKKETDILCPADVEAMVQILNRAYDAAKEVDSSIQTILHRDDGGHMNSYDFFLGKLVDAGVKFDVIGASFYPAWSQIDVAAAVDFINKVCEKYDKDLIIMETGYNWNDTRKDGYPGQLAEFEGYMEKFPFTPEGQAGYINELITGLKSVSGGRCLGFLYWDPMLIHVENEQGENIAGWAMRESDDKSDANVVENSTLFDFNGNALPALKVIKDHSENGMYINLEFENGVLSGTSSSKAMLDSSVFYFGNGSITNISQ